MARKPKKTTRRVKHKLAYRKLNLDQEFQLMKLVLDKFLWLGIGLVGVGLFYMISLKDNNLGFEFIGAGLMVMIVFGIAIRRYFETYV